MCIQGCFPKQQGFSHKLYLNLANGPLILFLHSLQQSMWHCDSLVASSVVVSFKQYRSLHTMEGIHGGLQLSITLSLFSLHCSSATDTFPSLHSTVLLFTPSHVAEHCNTTFYFYFTVLHIF